MNMKYLVVAFILFASCDSEKSKQKEHDDKKFEALNEVLSSAIAKAALKGARASYLDSVSNECLKINAEDPEKAYIYAKIFNMSILQNKEISIFELKQKSDYKK
jgi:hypothetical protein